MEVPYALGHRPALSDPRRLRCRVRGRILLLSDHRWLYQAGHPEIGTDGRVGWAPQCERDCGDVAPEARLYGKLTQLLNEQAIRLSSSPDDEAAVLKVGKLTGAREVVFLDSPIKEQTWSASTAGYYGWYGGQSQTQSGVAYQVSVSVRGVDVESGEVLWSGTAHYAAMVTDLDNRLRLLTCHALSTAWGLRPTGTARITRESICERDSQP